MSDQGIGRDGDPQGNVQYQYELRPVQSEEPDPILTWPQLHQGEPFTFFEDSPSQDFVCIKGGHSAFIDGQMCAAHYVILGRGGIVRVRTDREELPVRRVLGMVISVPDTTPF